MAEKDKKKTLTISTGFKKNIILTHLLSIRRRLIRFPKKKLLEIINILSRNKTNQGQPVNNIEKNKKFSRRFVEQQATKAFIKKDDKSPAKSKLKLKAPVDKRDFKMTVSRALNVEEIEIKQSSLASVRRARLKEKKLF